MVKVVVDDETAEGEREGTEGKRNGLATDQWTRLGRAERCAAGLCFGFAFGETLADEWDEMLSDCVFYVTPHRLAAGGVINCTLQGLVSLTTKQARMII